MSPQPAVGLAVVAQPEVADRCAAAALRDREHAELLRRAGVLCVAPAGRTPRQDDRQHKGGQSNAHVPTIRLRQAKFTARDDHGAAADLDALELLWRPVGPREQRRGAPDLDALRDLDLLAEADPPVA